jgi:hypothetical protein
MNACDVLKYGHLTVLGSVDQLSNEEWETPGACGVWSIKNIIAHLASYEVVIAEILGSFVDGSSTPTLDRMNELGADFNDREVDARAALTPRETLDEYVSHNLRAAALIARIPAETARQVGTIPWYGAEYSLEDLLVYMDYGHKREHCGQITVFRDKLRASAP